MAPSSCWTGLFLLSDSSLISNLCGETWNRNPKRQFRRLQSVQARSASKGIAATARVLQRQQGYCGYSKGIAVFYCRIIVPRFKKLNSLAGASGLYFVDQRPLVLINGLSCLANASGYEIRDMSSEYELTRYFLSQSI